MKQKNFVIPLLLIFILTISSSATAQDIRQSENYPSAVSSTFGTAITYQGYLEDSNGPINNDCDIQLTLYDDPGGGSQVGSSQYHGSVTVSDGYFTIPNLDYGWGIFKGQPLYMEISVRCPTGVGDMTILSPRQTISPAPYALALPGMYTTPGSEAPNVIGGRFENTVKDGVFGGTIGGGGANSAFNYVFDHVSTVSGGANNRAGSDDGNLWSADGATVSGGWNNTADNPISTVGGGANNYANGYAASVSGGEHNAAYNYAATVSGGYTNTVTGGAGTVSGGFNNMAADWADTVGGGEGNTAEGEKSTIGGGVNNTAQGYGSTIGGGEGNYTGDWTATVSGGYTNTATAPASTIGGGSDNHAINYDSTIAGGTGNWAMGQSSSVLGGQYNNAAGFGATVAGGNSNYAGGDFSFAAGEEAWANHNGTFVWSDASGGFGSTGVNQFLIDASGGVGIGTDSPGGPGLAVGGGGSGYMYLGSKGSENGWATYLGFNVYHNGSDYIAQGDGANNGGALMTTSWINGDIGFHTFDSTGVGNKVVTPNTRMSIDGTTGDVEIANDLDVKGNYRWTSGQNFYLEGSGEWSFDFPDADGNDEWHIWAPGLGSLLMVENDGDVSIGPSTPNARLEVAYGDLYMNNGQIGIGTSSPGYPIEIFENNPFIKFSDTDDGRSDDWLMGFSGSNQRFEIWEDLGSGWEIRFWIDKDGLAAVKKLQITGGDLAEPFLMSGEVEPGMVVVIDPENPGQLQLSSTANDPLVAGCVSGANGLDAGILMYDEIADEENAFPVALSGRVFCYADASYGVIQPGDFLSTSDTPGHLMVVKDREAAMGAIVGKAMSALDDGQGLVLILVTLQ